MRKKATVEKELKVPPQIPYVGEIEFNIDEGKEGDRRVGITEKRQEIERLKTKCN